ncbi:unnamed protein product [Onchocerca flexuosa]|uniref:Small, acid-soluble spore protein gamma-type n=1 Tax=Onchocerca flexuosa TaxID=387005 RepID=A0A183HW06_9BILA|nr:unnamed protein product [Onchocerca flexuosa]
MKIQFNGKFSKKQSTNESGKENKVEKSHPNNRQVEERHKEEADSLKQRERKNNYKLPSRHAHYHQKAERDHAVSPDNTLREITGGMPNIELKHFTNNETIYTDDQLM